MTSFSLQCVLGSTLGYGLLWFRMGTSNQMFQNDFFQAPFRRTYAYLVDGYVSPYRYIRVFGAGVPFQF